MNKLRFRPYHGQSASISGKCARPGRSGNAGFLGDVLPIGGTDMRQREFHNGQKDQDQGHNGNWPCNRACEKDAEIPIRE